MGSEWQIMTLEEAEVQLLDCIHKTPVAKEEGYPYVAIPQIKDGRIDLGDVRLISASDYLVWTKKARPEHWDIVLSRRCNPGTTAHVPRGLEFALGQNLVLLRSNGKYIFPPFLRWLTKSPFWWEEVKKYLNVGAVFDSLRCADIPHFHLPIPPIHEQRAIAHILGSLDDKIELNRKTNETLEAMARAVFKSWFVDFDPVRAKAEGRDPVRARRGESGFAPNLPPEILNLFPDSFIDSELGQIPKGWEIKTIGEVVEFAYGKALKASNRKTGTVPVFGSNGPVGLHNEALVKGPGIVIGRKGNPGIVTWSSKDFFPIDTTFYVKKIGNISSLIYLFYALKDQDLPSLSADSAVPGLNRNMAYMNNILVPSDKVLSAFDEQVVPLFKKIDVNDDESVTLAALRDTLLPKLISGELRVPDAEKFVEEVGL